MRFVQFDFWRVIVSLPGASSHSVKPARRLVSYECRSWSPGPGHQESLRQGSIAVRPYDHFRSGRPQRLLCCLFSFNISMITQLIVLCRSRVEKPPARVQRSGFPAMFPQMETTNTPPEF